MTAADDPTATAGIDRTYAINHKDRDHSPHAAMKRLRLILDTPANLLDDQYFVLSTHEGLEAAQIFIRDNLDNATGRPHDDHIYDNLAPELAKIILDDLQIIWGYEYLRDSLSHIAMELSLCPLHFCDWASCFDDQDDECAAIRLIFPHQHDT